MAWPLDDARRLTDPPGRSTCVRRQRLVACLLAALLWLAAGALLVGAGAGAVAGLGVGAVAHGALRRPLRLERLASQPASSREIGCTGGTPVLPGGVGAAATAPSGPTVLGGAFRSQRLRGLRSVAQSPTQTTSNGAASTSIGDLAPQSASVAGPAASSAAFFAISSARPAANPATRSPGSTQVPANGAPITPRAGAEAARPSSPVRGSARAGVSAAAPDPLAVSAAAILLGRIFTVWLASGRTPALRVGSQPPPPGQRSFSSQPPPPGQRSFGGSAASETPRPGTSWPRPHAPAPQLSYPQGTAGSQVQGGVSGGGDSTAAVGWLGATSGAAGAAVLPASWPAASASANLDLPLAMQQLAQQYGTPGANGQIQWLPYGALPGLNAAGPSTGDGSGGNGFPVMVSPTQATGGPSFYSGQTVGPVAAATGRGVQYVPQVTTPAVQYVPQLVGPTVQYVPQIAGQYTLVPSGATGTAGVPNIYVSTSTPVTVVNPITVTTGGRDGDGGDVGKADSSVNAAELLAAAALLRRPKVVIVPVVPVGRLGRAR